MQSLHGFRIAVTSVHLGAAVIAKTALILKDCVVCIICRDIYSAVRALSIYPLPMHHRGHVGGGKRCDDSIYSIRK